MWFKFLASPCIEDFWNDHHCVVGCSFLLGKLEIGDLNRGASEENKMSRMFHDWEFSIVSIAAITVGFVAAQSDDRRHGQSLARESENAFKEFVDALNPAYLIIIACLIAAGCAFELAYGTRSSSGRTDWSHVASRPQPYSVTTA